MIKPNLPTQLSELEHRLRTANEQQLRRVIIALGIAVALAALAFVGIYYRDRYVAPVTNLGEFDQRLAHLEAQIRQEPGNVELRVAIAQAYYTLRRYDGTVAQASEALKIEPDNQAALVLRALGYFQLDQADEASADFNHVLELNQDNQFAKSDQRLELTYYYLGVLHSQAGRYTEAQAAFQSALEINKGDADAWFQLGQASQGAGEHEAALDAYKQVVRFVPNYTEAYQAMERSYRALNQTALADYATGMVAFSVKDYQQAASLLEALIEQHPDVLEAYLGVGLSYEKLGARDKAIIALEHYLAERPDDIAARQALARVRQDAP